MIGPSRAHLRATWLYHRRVLGASAEDQLRCVERTQIESANGEKMYVLLFLEEANRRREKSSTNIKGGLVCGRFLPVVSLCS